MSRFVEGLRKFIEWVEFTLIGKFPTTNGRIALTMGLVIGTAVKYWTSADWKPSYEWLAFLAAMAATDVIQFSQKRKTHSDYVRAINGKQPE